MHRTFFCDESLKKDSVFTKNFVFDVRSKDEIIKILDTFRDMIVSVMCDRLSQKALDVSSRKDSHFYGEVKAYISSIRDEALLPKGMRLQMDNSSDNKEYTGASIHPQYDNLRSVSSMSCTATPLSNSSKSSNSFSSQANDYPYSQSRSSNSFSNSNSSNANPYSQSVESQIIVELQQQVQQQGDLLRKLLHQQSDQSREGGTGYLQSNSDRHRISGYEYESHSDQTPRQFDSRDIGERGVRGGGGYGSHSDHTPRQFDSRDIGERGVGGGGGYSESRHIKVKSEIPDMHIDDSARSKASDYPNFATKVQSIIYLDCDVSNLSEEPVVTDLNESLFDNENN